jgi:site-specific DNA recombinase
MNLVAYLRVSTEKQAREGVSLEAQEARIRGFASAMGHTVVEVCRDDGISGSLGPAARPALARALWRVEEEEAGDAGLVVTSLSRLSRSVRDILDLVDRARSNEWHLLSLSESLDTSTATGRMVVGVLAVLSQFERELIGERTAEAMSKLRGDGKAFTSIPPYGWKYVDGRMVPEPSEVAAREFIAARQGAGWGNGLIADRLNASGVLTRTGRPWDSAAVRRVLRAIERSATSGT